jgi:hypothetical protein
MRWLAAMVLVLATSTSHVMATSSRMLMPTPLGVSIHVASWVLKDDRKVFYVEVVAQGRTAQEAQELAMRMAVERAVGSILASNTSTERGRLARDEIIVYSAGYVDDHRVVEQHTVDDQIQVRMQIWVGHSRLAHRLLGESRTEGAIEGGRISEQISSFQQQRKASDQILLAVLRDYPARSFRIDLRRTRVWVDTDRETYLDIPFLMAWDPNYLASLAEAVKVINQRADCDSWLSSCDLGSMRQRVTRMIQVGRARGWFDDEVAYDLMYREMVQSRPKIRLRLYDTANQLRFQSCFNLATLDQQEWSNWTWADIGGGRAQINPDRQQLVTITIKTAQLPLQNLDRAEIDVIRLADCSNTRR